MALEHLLISLPEIFREKRVNDGIHGGITVRQAVGGDPEEEGGGCQWEDPKLSPEVDDVVWQPGDPENHDHHQHRLRGLGEGKERQCIDYSRKGTQHFTARPARIFCVFSQDQVSTKSALGVNLHFVQQFCSKLPRDRC